LQVILLPAAVRAFRALVSERFEESGLDAAQKLDERFRRIFRLLETAELGSARPWAPPQYRFVPADAFLIIWRKHEIEADIRVVVRIVLQRASPDRMTRHLPYSSPKEAPLRS
jgi:plasmid stabilization system protein ParE